MFEWQKAVHLLCIPVMVYAVACARPMGTFEESADAPSGCVVAAQCVNMNGPCMQGACINGECKQVPANDFEACDDGRFCTINDVCQEGTCLGANPRFCASADDCHIGICDEDANACMSASANEGAICDDGDLCTRSGTCNDGLCVGAPPVDCSIFAGECLVGACDPGVGCIAQLAPDGAECDDGRDEFCTAGRCNSGQCSTAPSNEGVPCDDNLFCTTGEVCRAGTCVSNTEKRCSAPSECWIAYCDETLDICTSITGYDGIACDDGNPCTIDSACLSGACLAGTPGNDGAACEDGLSCTSAEVCASGACVSSVSPFVYFIEDFASNSKGWTLGPEWQIGPAKASVGGILGADPPSDHTLSADNGLAGVVIGGNAASQAHPFHYLESPAFDTSKASGAVVLSFYRWLNSDFMPRMDNSVEVWNGSEWIALWTSGLAPRVQDSPPVGRGWTFVEYDVTAYKSAEMRLRFGVGVNAAPFAVGSWNVDDIVVADVACP